MRRSRRRRAPLVPLDPRTANPLDRIRDTERAAGLADVPWTRFGVTSLDRELSAVGSAVVSILSLGDYRGVRELSEARVSALAKSSGACARWSGRPLGPDGDITWNGADFVAPRSSWADVADVLAGRDVSLAVRVRELADTLTDELPPLPSRRRRRVWSDDGSDYDFDRLQDFHARPASARKRTVRSDPGVVHLVATFGGSCWTTADQLAWAGAPCLAVARALLDAGYSVSLDGVMAAEAQDRPGSASVLVVKMLEAGSSHEADDAALAGVACDAAASRTAAFLAETLSDPEFGSGMGFFRLNPARVYQAVARTGALPEPTWCFEPSFSRDQALTSARTALRAIVERLDPASVLDERGAHDVAMSS